MSEFLIKTGEALDAADDIIDCAVLLNDSVNEINAVMNAIGNSLGSSSAGIVAQLSELSNDLLDQKNNITNLGVTLQKIVEEYKKTDFAVVEKNAGVGLNEGMQGQSAPEISSPISATIMKTAYSPEYRKQRFVVKDIYGYNHYDWDEIDHVLGKSADRITANEYAELSKVYLEMSDSDMSKFLSILAYKKEEVTNKPIMNVRYQQKSFTTWEYNKEKIDNLNTYLGACAEAYDKYNDSWNDLLENPKDEMEMIDAVQSKIIQRMALLDTLYIISSENYGTPSFKMGDQYIEGKSLNGEAGAEGPYISVTTEPDGSLKVNYYNTKSSMIYSRSDIMNVNNLNEKSISISTPYESDMPQRVNDASFKYYCDTFSYGSDEFLDEVGTGVAEGIGTLSRDTLLQSAAPFVGIPLDALLGAAEKCLENQERLRDVVNTTSAITEALDGQAFGMKGVLVSSGQSDFLVMEYSTKKTDYVLERLNKVIEENKINVGNIGLEYPITRETIKTNREDLHNLIMNRDLISGYDYERIINPWAPID
jgi:hypothetical protein